MLDIINGQRNTMCDGINRRNFLRIAGLGIGGWTLADLMQASAAVSEGNRSVRDKSIVLLFLAGGPSQYETFDPKPNGLENFKSINGHIPTSIPGVRFSSYLPRLAGLADRLSVVRSFQTNHAEHNGAHKQLMTGDLTVGDGQPIRQPGIGSLYARAAGAVNARTGMLRHALIPPTTRYPGAGNGFAGAFESVIEGAQPAYLGPSYSPVRVLVPMAGGDATVRNRRNRRNRPGDEPNPFVESMQLQVPRVQFDARLDLLQQFNQANRQLDAAGQHPLQVHQRQALELLRSGTVRQAFDLRRESRATLRAYDTEHFRNWRCDDNSRFIRNSPSIGFSLGRQLLLARRLCEAGCGFVTVVNANWDFHARRGIPNIPEGMGVFAPPLDHAVSAFLEDIRERGLEDKILLIITGEFGRTGLDDNAGRHHWPQICPLVLAGGGLRHGQVIGNSDRRGREPAGDPITIDDLHATIMHFLFDVAQMRLDVSLPDRVFDRAQSGRPISALF